MERVRPRRCWGLVRLSKWSRLRLGLRSFHVEQWQIVDRSGPGEFHVIECWVMVGPCWKLWIRQHKKDDVPQCRGNKRPARKCSLDPAVFEETLDREFLRNQRPTQDRFQAAAKPLMKTSPRDIQFRRAPCGQAYGGASHGSGRSRTAARTAARTAECTKRCQRHIPFDSPIRFKVARRGRFDADTSRHILRIRSEIMTLCLSGFTEQSRFCRGLRQRGNRNLKPHHPV